MPTSSGVGLHRVVINFAVNFSLKGKQVSEERKLDHFVFALEAKTGSDKGVPGKYDLSLHCVFPKYKSAEPSEQKKSVTVLLEYSVIGSPTEKLEKYFTFTEKKLSGAIMALKESEFKKVTKSGAVTVEAQIRLLPDYLERPKTAAMDSSNLRKAWNESDVVFLVERKEVHCHKQVLMQSPILLAIAFSKAADEEERVQTSKSASKMSNTGSEFEYSDAGANPDAVELPNKSHGSFLKLIKLFYPALFFQDLDEETIYELEPMLVEYDVFRAKAGRRLMDTLKQENSLRALASAYRLQYDPLKEAAMEEITKMTPGELRRDHAIRDLDQQMILDIEDARAFSQEEEQGERKLPPKEKAKPRPATRGGVQGQRKWKPVF